MLKEFKKNIDESKSFLLVAHASPDGDAIGSTLAMGKFLENMGKTVFYFCVDDVPYFLKFLVGSDRFTSCIESIKSVDTIIALDCGEYNRLGIDIKKIVKYNAFMNLDHHISNDSFADINLIDCNASCTGEIVMNIIEYFNGEFTPEISEALFVSVITDTGSFRYGCTTAKSFKMASKLVQFGVMPWKISSEIYENNPIEKINLLKDVLGTLHVDKSTLFASIDITKRALKKNNATKDMTDSFVNYPRSIKGVSVAILFRELDGKVKLSMRSIDDYNVSDFCKRYGGGGHKHAAGCFLEGTLVEVKERIYRDLRDWFKLD